MSERINLGKDERLILKNHQISRRAATLFRDLSENEELQKMFIESPAEVIGQEILGQDYTPEQASAVNKFIFAILANDELPRWAAKYEAENAGKELTPEKRRADIVKAFVEYGDTSLMTGLLDIAATGALVPGIDKAALIIKADSWVVGNWFIYKVSGLDFGEETTIPVELVQQVAEQLVIRAKQEII